jgi:hypothetical protein
VAKRPTEEPVVTQTDSGVIELEPMLESLVNEAIRSRLRHRALLRTLAAAGQLDIAQYLEAYQAEEEQHFQPLLGLLLMQPERFRERYREWLEAEREQFGFMPTAIHGVQFSKRMSGEELPPENKPKHAKPAKKKKISP